MRHEVPAPEASDTGEKILIFSPFPALPANQGNRARLFWLCELLRARGFALHFILHMRENGGRVDAEMLESHTSYFDAFYYLPFTGSDQPVTDKYCDPDAIWDPGIEPALKSILKDVDYQAAIINYAPFARVARLLPRQTVTFLDAHDRMGRRRETLEEAGIKPSFYFFTEETERKMCEDVDFVIAIKEAERLYFETLLDRPALTLGTVPKQQVVTPEKTDGIVDFAFLGSLNSVNEHVVEQLQVHLSERVSTFAGRAKFRVFGKIASLIDDSCLACRAQILEPVGFIDSLDDMYAASDVVIVPTERSTGLKIKTVEALQTGVAVISTEDGFDGVPSDHAFHNCLDISEVLDKCDAVCRGELAIEDLRLASKQVAIDYQQSFDRAFNGLCTAMTRPALRIRLRLGRKTQLQTARDLVSAAVCIRAFSLHFDIELVDDKGDLTEAEIPALKSLGAGAVKQIAGPGAPLIDACIGAWSIPEITEALEHGRCMGLMIDLDGLTGRDEETPGAALELLDRALIEETVRQALGDGGRFTLYTCRDALSAITQDAPALDGPEPKACFALTVPPVAIGEISDWGEQRLFVINAVGHGYDVIDDLLSTLMSLYGEGVYLPPVTIITDSADADHRQGLPISVAIATPRDMALMLLKEQWFVNVDLSADNGQPEAGDVRAYACSSPYAINFVDTMKKVARARSFAGADAQISYTPNRTDLILAALAAHGRPGFEHINTTRRRTMPPYGDLPSILRRSIAAHAVTGAGEP